METQEEVFKTRQHAVEGSHLDNKVELLVSSSNSARETGNECRDLLKHANINRCTVCEAKSF